LNVVPDGSPPSAVGDPVTDYNPSGRPGGRAPHVRLMRGHEQISTIDLFGLNFVLLTGRDGGDWHKAAAAIGKSWPPLVAYTIGNNGELSDPDGDWNEIYGVDADGAVLVRPDGYVAWRSRSGASNLLEALRAAIDALLGKVSAMA